MLYGIEPNKRHSIPTLNSSTLKLLCNVRMRYGPTILVPRGPPTSKYIVTFWPTQANSKWTDINIEVYSGREEKRKVEKEDAMELLGK